MGAPPVKSRLGRCGLCESRVWISASSPKADEIMCGQCASDTAEPGDKVEPLTERQIADIRKARAQ
jgi:recombinational DNA repair protein (RecF pathway)